MQQQLIEGVKVKKLKPIVDERGFLMEILRNDDKDFFTKFGQVYISACNPGYSKAWHYHEKQTDTFVVIKGNAKVVLFDKRKDSKTFGKINEFIMGEDNPLILQIPPLVVHGFSALNNKKAFLLNIPNALYNYEKPDEQRIALDSKEIPYQWENKKGW